METNDRDTDVNESKTVDLQRHPTETEAAFQMPIKPLYTLKGN